MSSVKSSYENNVLRITLADPASGNLLNDDMLNGILAAMDKWSRAGVLVLAGEGPDFSIGRPKPKVSKGLAQADAARVRAALELVNTVNLRLRGWPGATVAVLRGQAKGAAAGFVSNSDVVIAETGSTLGFPEMTYDLAPALVASYLPNRTIPRVAQYLLLTGEQIDVERALMWGLVHEIHTPEKVGPRAEELIAFLAARAEGAIDHCKQSLYAFQHKEHAVNGPVGVDRVIEWLSRK